MSNAMRSGKRTLAALAAGALGVALIPFVAAAPASAGAASTIVFGVPSVTVIGSDFTVATGNTAAQIPVPVYLLDAAGDVVSTADDTAGVSVELSITKPATATDDSIKIDSLSGTSTGTATKQASSTFRVSSGLLLNGGQTGATTVSPNGIAGTSWDSVADGTSFVGTYTITARLFATGSGAVISTASIPFTLTTGPAAPAATVNFTNNNNLVTNANVINGIGAQKDDSLGMPNGSTYVYLTNATGGPYYIRDDSVSIAYSSTVPGTQAFSVSGGLEAGSVPNAVYTFTEAAGSTAKYGTSNTTVTGTVAPAGGTSSVGTIPVGVAQSTLTSAPSVTFGTTPSYRPSLTDDSYQVPPGTTSLSFTALASDSISSGSIAYNTTSTATVDVSGGVVTTSGGRATVTSDSATINLTLNAAAAASGETLYLTVGDYVANKTRIVEVDFVKPAATVDPTAPITKVSSETVVTGTVLTQYGAVLPGTWAVSAKAGASASCSATSIAVGTADAAGKFSLTIPAAFAATAAGTKTFTICASNGFTTAQANETVTYTASGGLSSLTMTVTSPSTSNIPVIQTPPSAVVDLTTDTTNTVTAATIAQANVNAAGTGTSFQVTVTSNPAATITMSGPTGVFFTTSTTGSLSASSGRNPLVTATSGSGVTYTKPIQVYATKPGTHTVTVTAGTSTATITFVAGVAIGSGRTLTADPTSISLAPNEFKSVSVKLVDLYGNPVPDDTGITAALAGGGTLSAATATNANGISTAYYTAPLGTGKGQVNWSMAAGKYISAVISGYPAAVNTAATAIDVTSGGGGDKSIVIVGERGTVSGKPGIIVDGTTKGLDASKTVIPYVRFPGGEYTQGTARPTISAAGDFEWSRKTGKKSYVYFTNDDGSVVSNRIIIAAS